VIVTATAIFIALRVDSGIASIEKTIIAASDLNLEAHQRLLEHFEDLERAKARKAHDDWMRTR
jgi:hypothetical protein